MNVYLEMDLVRVKIHARVNMTEYVEPIPNVQLKDTNAFAIARIDIEENLQICRVKKLTVKMTGIVWQICNVTQPKEYVLIRVRAKMCAVKMLYVVWDVKMTLVARNTK